MILRNRRILRAQASTLIAMLAKERDAYRTELLRLQGEVAELCRDLATARSQFNRLAALTSARHKALAEMTAYARELAIVRAQLAQRDPTARLN
jgi:hypothetical protein